MSLAGALATCPFADHRHGLITSNRLRGRREALEAQPWTNKPFDAPVILLDDVIQELHLPDFGKAPEFSALLHGFCRDWIGGILVDREGSRIGRMRLLQRLPEKASCRGGIPLGREQKVDRLPVSIDGSVEIDPFALHPDICLIHTPGAVCHAQMRAHALV